MSETLITSLTSLMELATVDTSDMSAQISRLPSQGIYIIELSKLGFGEQPTNDPAKPMNFGLGIEGTILAFDPLDENEDGSKKEGQSLRERYFLFGENIQEAIQLLMGRFKLAGFRHKGIMGGVEGAEPGWVDDALGKRVAVRVRHAPRKDGSGDNAYMDWLSPKAMEKNDLNWEVLARPFLDENGKEVELESAA